MNDTQDNPATNGDQSNQPHIALQKIYVRDASIEVPDGPQVFTQDFNPELNVDLNTQIQELGEDGYQVMLTVTVNAKQGENTAYIVEVQQAGVFQVSGFGDEEQRAHALGAYCPGVLFPFVRESVGDMIQRAGFPHFLLQPVNFDALYQEQHKQGAQAAAPVAH